MLMTIAILSWLLVCCPWTWLAIWTIRARTRPGRVVFIKGKLAVAVFVELLQSSRRVGNFISGNDAVAVRVQHDFNRRPWGTRSCQARAGSPGWRGKVGGGWR